MTIKNILLAVDVKSTDRLLLDHALQIATKFMSKVWIVHVAAPNPDFVGYDVGPTYIREGRAEELRNEHKKLHTYLSEFENKKITADALLVQGPTIEMLMEEIKKLKVDLLMMGNHKHNFFYEIFVGNTTIDMVKKQTIPMMIIPLPDED